MADDRPAALHFHFGPARSGVGVFIDKVFTDPRLPWRTVHLSGDDTPGGGRLGVFLAGVALVARRGEAVVFAHTLKAGLACAFARLLRPGLRLVYVGHGVRFAQKRARWADRVRFTAAERAVYAAADAVIHIRARDVEDARGVVGPGLMRKVSLLPPRLAA